MQGLCRTGSGRGCPSNTSSTASQAPMTYPQPPQLCSNCCPLISYATRCLSQTLCIWKVLCTTTRFPLLSPLSTMKNIHSSPSAPLVLFSITVGPFGHTVSASLLKSLNLSAFQPLGPRTGNCTGTGAGPLQPWLSSP